MATATPRRPAKAKVVPARGANFEARTPSSAKSARKAVRKSLVRAAVTNKVSDARLNAKERAAFYARLRQLKMRRRKIADEFAVLASMVGGLQREVQTVEDRYRSVDAGLVDEALLLVKAANSAVSAAADEFHGFSRRKVFYTEAVAA